MDENSRKIVLSGIDIPFLDLVIFIVKFTLASIPALFIIWLIFMLLGMVFGGAFGMFVHPVGF